MKFHDGILDISSPSLHPGSLPTQEAPNTSQYFRNLLIKLTGVIKTSKLARRGRKLNSILKRFGCSVLDHHHHNKATRKSPRRRPWRRDAPSTPLSRAPYHPHILLSFINHRGRGPSALLGSRSSIFPIAIFLDGHHSASKPQVTSTQPPSLLLQTPLLCMLDS